MFLDNLEYRDYIDLSRLIHRSDLSRFRDVDLIVGIPRSGMVPAYMIGLILDIPVMDIESFVSGVQPYVGNRIHGKVNSIKRVLVVDDSVKFGGQMKKAKDKLKYLTSIDVFYLSVFATSESKVFVDHWLEVIDQPRVFQWNLLNSWIYEYSCVDIDGVLCEDPSEEENDDGEKYLYFLENAVPKYLPPCKVGVLVTSRLEKYRFQTEAWLEQNKVKYDYLEMLDLPDKETRVKLGIHASFKSKIYQQYEKSSLFIESSLSQSERIHYQTGKHVFCVENMTFYNRRVDNKKDIISRIWGLLKKG